MLGFAQDQMSLDNLHDIVAPASVPWWPPAPGWYFLGALLLIAAACLVVRSVRHWWTNRYRGAALNELTQLRNSIDNVGTQHAVGRLDQILKRVALAVWPREQVAQLSGEQWIEFLIQNANPSASANAFQPEQTRVLRDAAYSSKSGAELSDAQVDELFVSAEHWIRRHRVPDDIASIGGKR